MANFDKSNMEMLRSVTDMCGVKIHSVVPPRTGGNKSGFYCLITSVGELPFADALTAMNYFCGMLHGLRLAEQRQEVKA